ncbi:hypothetical protein ACLB1G_04970 [Oxalobacteraceae bacterium A2-2]
MHAILRRMARRIVFMLITLLALQFSWSVVAAYCTHETGRAAQHLGHHPDTNAADDVAASDPDQAPDKTSAHTHCSSCAHGALSMAGMAAIVHPRLAEAAPTATGMIPSPYTTAPPERPQWTAAA